MLLELMASDAPLPLKVDWPTQVRDRGATFTDGALFHYWGPCLRKQRQVL